MTFALIGYCAESGQLGACAATSDIAVGARVTHAEAGTGAVLTQHRTDPRLGHRGLDLLRSGCTADETLQALVASTHWSEWRQLAVVDRVGHTASFSGSRLAEPKAEAHGGASVAIGNILAHEQVVHTMVAEFESRAGQPLAERLMRVLEAGRDAGGEGRPLASAALLVVADQRFPRVDLRVDLSDDAVGQLREAWDTYRPAEDEFVARALDPDTASGDWR